MIAWAGKAAGVRRPRGGQAEPARYDRVCGRWRLACGGRVRGQGAALW
ncbi:hypothetical protein [[Actinomadura] parvosata]|nr:hypothetical protein [Nonomuraea sp. ATCC 55076]